MLEWIAKYWLEVAFGLLAAGLGTFIKLQWTQNKAIKAGMQAILRDCLIHGYRECRAKGFADWDDRSNWENMYTQYHSLGANGVMTDIRNKFLALPTSKMPDGNNNQ